MCELPKVAQLVSSGSKIQNKIVHSRHCAINHQNSGSQTQFVEQWGLPRPSHGSISLKVFILTPRHSLPFSLFGIFTDGAKAMVGQNDDASAGTRAIALN